MRLCRFGIGRFTTEEEVDYTADRIIHQVKRLREMRSALLIIQLEGVHESADYYYWYYYYY